MPFCTVTTNVAQSSIPKDFHLRLNALLAEVLSKNPVDVTVMVKGDVQMCCGPADAPTVHMSVLSMGVFTSGKNKEYGKPLLAFLTKELGVTKELTSIYFQDIPLDSVPTMRE